MPVPSDKMILTVKEAAEILDISANTCYEWTHIEGFPAVRIGKCVRIHRDQLLEWFKARAGGSL